MRHLNGFMARSIPLFVALALLGGCSAGAKRDGAYVDKLPLPIDTMLTKMIEPGVYGGRFVFGATAGPKTFNAIMGNETSTTDITQRLFCALTDIDYVTQDDIGVLAKSWETTPDGLTTTFHLRRGAAFSDGHPITSDDVKFSFDVVMDPEIHPSTQDGLTIDGVPATYTAPDSFTFVVHTTKADALILAHTGSVNIMPKHMLEAAFKAGQFASAYGTDTPPESLVTSGAFRVKSFVPDQQVVLSRNPYWFGVDAKGQRLPYLDELVFVVAKDQNVAALKFHAGELDGLDNVKPEDYKAFTDNQAKEGFTLHDVGPSFNTNFFWFNLNRAKEAKDGRKVGEPYVSAAQYSWFSDKRFRQAMSMAVDREAIIRGPFYGFAFKNWSTMTSGNKKWFDPETKGIDYNPEEAKRLLASMGMKDTNGDGFLEDAKGRPVQFTMITNGDNKLRTDMINLVKDDLAKVGVKMIPSPLDFNTMITKLRSDFSYESALLGLGSAVPSDPGMGQNVWKSSGLTHYWNIKQAKPGTPEEARVDQLMMQNILTHDMAVRRQTWHEVMQIVNDQCWLIWLPSQQMKLPVRSRFGNVQPSPMPHRILWNADRIFRKPGK